MATLRERYQFAAVRSVEGWASPLLGVGANTWSVSPGGRNHRPTGFRRISTTRLVRREIGSLLGKIGPA